MSCTSNPGEPTAVSVPEWLKLSAETVRALRDYVAVRPKPKTEELTDRVFLTATGSTLFAVNDNPIGVAFRALPRRTNLYRPQRGMYDLRRTFRTVADATKDQPAWNLHSCRDQLIGGVFRPAVPDKHCFLGKEA